MISALLWGAVALALCAGLIPIMIRAALRFGVVAHPDANVAAHTRTVPLLGGVAIVLGIVPALGAAAAIDPRWRVLALALLPIVALGFYKDRVGTPLSPIVQLLVQGTAAGILIAHGLRLHLISNPTADVGLSMLVILWIINSWNFVDVTDGLAGTLAAVSAFGVAISAASLLGADTVMVAIAIVGSALGFLLYNRPPARIFMGDAGSFSLGIMFAALIMVLASQTPMGAGALLLVAVPLADVVFSIGARLWSRRSPLTGSVDHLSLLLLARGWAVRTVLGLAAAIAAGLVVLAYQFV